jgi:hypothetical protein
VFGEVVSFQRPQPDDTVLADSCQPPTIRAYRLIRERRTMHLLSLRDLLLQEINSLQRAAFRPRTLFGRGMRML